MIEFENPVENQLERIMQRSNGSFDGETEQIASKKALKDAKKRNSGDFTSSGNRKGAGFKYGE